MCIIDFFLLDRACFRSFQADAISKDQGHSLFTELRHKPKLSEHQWNRNAELLLDPHSKTYQKLRMLVQISFPEGLDGHNVGIFFQREFDESFTVFNENAFPALDCQHLFAFPSWIDEQSDPLFAWTQFTLSLYCTLLAGVHTIGSKPQFPDPRNQESGGCR